MYLGRLREGGTEKTSARRTHAGWRHRGGHLPRRDFTRKNLSFLVRCLASLQNQWIGPRTYGAQFPRRTTSSTQATAQRKFQEITDQICGKWVITIIRDVKHLPFSVPINCTKSQQTAEVQPVQQPPRRTFDDRCTITWRWCGDQFALYLFSFPLEFGCLPAVFAAIFSYRTVADQKVTDLFEIPDSASLSKHCS